MPDVSNNAMQKLLTFVNELDRRRIHRRLASVREAVMVEVHVPGARWEVEFFADGHVEVEVFKSAGGVLSHAEAESACSGCWTRMTKPKEARFSNPRLTNISASSPSPGATWAQRSRLSDENCSVAIGNPRPASSASGYCCRVCRR
jgi:hypothetical protein